MGWKRVFILCVVALGLESTGLAYAGVRLIDGTSIDVSNLTKVVSPTVVYDNEGHVYMEIGGTPPNLSFKQVPAVLQNAIVATEDHTFWSSSSIDPRSIIRSALVDLVDRSTDQGASTIPEQLAKITYLNDNKTVNYKLKEILLGIEMERYFTKQEILTMYLNKVFLGENTTGVEAAAMRYFGVDLTNSKQKLTLPQAALLAGLPQAPTSYDPLMHPQAARQRRNLVLQNMLRYGYISQSEATAAENAPLGVSYHSLPSEDPWTQHPLFANFLFDYAERQGISSGQLLQGGLKIYTTVDPKVQAAINTVFWSKNYHGDFPGPTSGTIVQGAAVFVDPKTGGILGAAGSREHGYTPLGIDRVYSHSSPGSSIKPIMEYAPAIQSGKWTPTSILDNRPQDFGDGYEPQNWDYYAPTKVTLQYGLEWSQNVASVWLLDKIGIQTGADFATKDGIGLTPTDRQHLGIAIGGMENGVDPLQMAQAYQPFDNHGVQVQPHLITSIVNAEGQIIYFDHPTTKRVMTQNTATTMTRLMEDVVDYGTGTGAKVPGWGVAGKTGTVQYSAGLTGDSNWVRNAWFDGYTPNLVGSIYLGYDNASPEHHLTMSPLDPSANASLLFADIVRLAESGTNPVKFQVGPFPASQGTATAAYYVHQKSTKSRREITSHRRATRPHPHPKPHPAPPRIARPRPGQHPGRPHGGPPGHP